ADGAGTGGTAGRGRVPGPEAAGADIGPNLRRGPARSRENQRCPKFIRDAAGTPATPPPPRDDSGEAPFLVRRPRAGYAGRPPAPKGAAHETVRVQARALRVEPRHADVEGKVRPRRHEDARRTRVAGLGTERRHARGRQPARPLFF